MFALFTTLCIIWAVYVWRNKEQAHRIHILMGMLCAFKALTCMSQVRVARQVQPGPQEHTLGNRRTFTPGGGGGRVTSLAVRQVEGATGA
jgi:hypothetical protein